jgi:ABC-type dipeptide/oligopeptide/nickel transport system ATPase component
LKGGDLSESEEEETAEEEEVLESDLLVVQHLGVTFPLRSGSLQAVRDVGFRLKAGETLGIVGESGSGKSACVSALMGLIPTPPARITGSASFLGQDLILSDKAALRKIRGERIAMIFQDPMTSLNPYQRIIDQVAEPLRIHREVSKEEARAKAIEALEAVGIPNASERAYNWPHEFSGGMRQRVMIAMAMITEPEILIADEPTTALDVTVQRQILELIKSLQQKHGMAVIFISHDLAVVSKVCSRILVMQKGRIVEAGNSEDVMRNPQHPYTRGLLQCTPALHEPGTRLTTLEDVLAEAAV